MSSSKKIKRLHDTIYYEEKSIQNTKESFKQLYKILDLKKITSNLKILDVGCGNGNLIFYLNKKIPNAQITGVDIDKKLLGIVKKNTSKKNKLIKYNIIKKNQKKIDKFDIIISAGVLAIFDNPEIFFQNIKKNLKKNGVIYLFGNFTYYPFNIYTKYQDFVKYPNIFQSGFNVFSIEYIKKYFKNKKIKIYPFFINKNIKKNKKDLIRSWTENYKGRKYFINALDFYQKQMWIKITN